MAKHISARPRQYWDDYASRFKHRCLAEAYELRPPYPDETYEILRYLLGDSPGRVLDVGCGPGKIARNLVEYVEGVDAVDFSCEITPVQKRVWLTTKDGKVHEIYGWKIRPQPLAKCILRSLARMLCRGDGKSGKASVHRFVFKELVRHV